MQMSRYYNTLAKPDIAWSEPEEEVTFEQSVIPPGIQINPVIEQRYAYTFVRAN